VSKSAQQEQVRVQIRTKQNTILPPPEPLRAEGLATELRTEVATTRTSNIPSINSSVAAGGTLTLIPVSSSNNNNNERSVRHRVTNAASNNNTGSAAANSYGDISVLLEMMNNNTRVMIRRPFAEVQRDHEAVMLSLQKAKDDDDDSRVMFYEIAVHNLFKELQLMDA
jgi:hypothetical protein